MMRKMAYLDSIYAAARNYINSGNTAKWAERNPEAWELYAAARTLELKHGK